MDAITAHLARKPLMIAERFQMQKEGESIKTYAASIQKLAEHCNFGNSPAGSTGIWHEEQKSTAMTTNHE